MQIFRPIRYLKPRHAPPDQSYHIIIQKKIQKEKGTRKDTRKENHTKLFLACISKSDGQSNYFHMKKM